MGGNIMLFRGPGPPEMSTDHLWWAGTGRAPALGPGHRDTGRRGHGQTWRMRHLWHWGVLGDAWDGRHIGCGDHSGYRRQFNQNERNYMDSLMDDNTAGVDNTHVGVLVSSGALASLLSGWGQTPASAGWGWFSSVHFDWTVETDQIRILPSQYIHLTSLIVTIDWYDNRTNRVTLTRSTDCILWSSILIDNVIDNRL